ncbi:hypothetical protein FB567DRAFT_528167 [Paraphoma chrysanthemicola]|uniref:Uncharacterized protein n=1 Tax=Paraphoma chrysanthemicola TaxID=798071 RepID=A0A8K0R572_9PLEO|nr:hypothetical protein FB567DRAFT_528167 [Paraphoma chrysanthemicola]
MQSAIYACTRPVIDPNDDTVQEVTAFHRLSNLRCQSTPQLLQFMETAVRPGTHKEGIARGFLVIILMTKVPGVQLSYQAVCAMSKAKRDEAREAFREALEDVWACGVQPNDSTLRNIVWDEQHRKCYIVDLEDCRVVDVNATPPEFCDEEYRSWGLGEASHE